VQRLDVLEENTHRKKEELFARNIQVLRLELSAWIAHVEKRTDASIALMHQAVDLEASTPKAAVTPGPTLPAPELLGDLLMEQNKPAEAIGAYKRSLELYPRRFNSLLGAARAARATNDDSQSRSFYKQFIEVAADGLRQSPVNEAKEYLARKG
jgi:tetratricopeptide (TPR) repeat protein